MIPAAVRVIMPRACDWVCKVPIAIGHHRQVPHPQAHVLETIQDALVPPARKFAPCGAAQIAHGVTIIV